MTNVEIIRKMIKKAKGNGYVIKWGDLESALRCPRIVYWEVIGSFYGHPDNRPNTSWFSLNDIIFSHSFAKAFWGEATNPFCDKCNVELRDYGGNSWGWQCPKCDDVYLVRDLDSGKWKPKRGICEGWRFHIRRMSLEEDRLKYIEKFLTKKEEKNE